jgi:methyltransferase
MAVVLLATSAVFLMMLAELQLARYNERVLRSRGAIEPSDDVYAVMRWAYPACFAAMAIEGAAAGVHSPQVLMAGLVLFGLAKILKFWAVATLGILWTFKVLVLPEHPVRVAGPYRYMSHPNYVAVLGELGSFAMIVGAPFTGVLALGFFGWLLRARIRVEERALKR